MQNTVSNQLFGPSLHKWGCYKHLGTVLVLVFLQTVSLYVARCSYICLITCNVLHHVNANLNKLFPKTMRQTTPWELHLPRRRLFVFAQLQKVSLLVSRQSFGVVCFVVFEKSLFEFALASSKTLHVHVIITHLLKVFTQFFFFSNDRPMATPWS